MDNIFPTVTVKAPPPSPYAFCQTGIRPHLWEIASLAANGDVEQVGEGRLTDTCEVILLYPTVDLSLSASYTDRGRKLRIRTINLNQP